MNDTFRIFFTLFAYVFLFRAIPSSTKSTTVLQPTKSDIYLVKSTLLEVSNYIIVVSFLSPLSLSLSLGMLTKFRKMPFDKSFLTPGRLAVVITAIYVAYWIPYLIFNDQYYEDMEEDDFKFALKQFFPDNVSCYFDELTEKDYYTNYTNKYRSTNLYFHFTPCWYTIKLAQLCAIEAASRAYRYDNVYVFFCKPLQFSKAHRKLLDKIIKQLPRSVKFERIYIGSYIEETPFRSMMYSFFDNGLFKKYKRLEEVLKLTALYLNGGIVLDTDVIVTEVPDIPKHWLIREKTGNISSAMLSFNTNKAFLIDESIALFDDQFKNYTLSTFLNSQFSSCLEEGGCKDIKVLDKDIVNVKYTDKAGKIPPAFAYRIVDEKFERQFPNHSLLGLIAEKYCPLVYSQSYLFE